MMFSCLIKYITVSSISITIVQSLVTLHPKILQISTKNIPNAHCHRLYSKNFLGELWEEFVEFSTYGPSERRMLKARRDAAAGRPNNQNSVLDENDNDEAWQTAFKNAALKTNQESDHDKLKDLDYDGYNLRDLIVNKWGVPLDIDFQRIPGLQSIYCTILPFVGYDSRRSRHLSELDYLMHLQGVVEILHKYDNLDMFIDFIESTDKVPKPGTDSVPYRLTLTEEQLNKIISNV